MKNLTPAFKGIALAFALLLATSGLWASLPVDSLRQKMNEALAKYQFEEAIDFGNAALALDSCNVGLLLQLGDAHRASGQGELALSCFIQAVAVDSLNAPAHFKLARYYENRRDFAEALATYKRLFEIDDSRAYFYRYGASLAAKMGILYDAIQWNLRSIELDPKSLAAYHALAELWIEMRGFYPADTLIAAALALDSNDVRSLYLAGKSAYLQQDYMDAVKRFRKLFDLKQGSAQAARYHGISLYHIKQYTEALEVLQELIAEASELDFPHYYRALCYQALDDPLKAEAEFKAAIAKVKVKNLALYHESLGIHLQSQSRDGDAIAHLRLAQQLDPDPEKLYHIALSYDRWYADKNMAISAYESYLHQTDSSVYERVDYASKRSNLLRREAHFSEKEDGSK